MASSASNHAAAAAPVFGSSSLKIPPRWDPQAATAYPFKKWVQDVLLWSMVTDLPLTQQAPAVVLQQTGTVREILRSIDPGVLAQGGVLDLMDGYGPRAQTGLTIVLYLLSQKFSPLGYESNVMASQMLMLARASMQHFVVTTRFGTRQRKRPIWILDQRGPHTTC